MVGLPVALARFIAVIYYRVLTVMAAQKVHRYVYPDKKLRFQYTTSSSALQEKLGVASAA